MSEVQRCIKCGQPSDTLEGLCTSCTSKLQGDLRDRFIGPTYTSSVIAEKHSGLGTSDSPTRLPDGARPRLLDQYELIELVSTGLVQVYKARQTSLNRVVALKILSPALTHEAANIARFRREATLAASLYHPNIVQVFAAGESNGTHYFVMEFIEGESLQQRLRREGRLQPAEAIRISLQVAQALEYAWRVAQIIHRDVKPSNIFLTRDGKVKLGDLGLAKSLGEGAHSASKSDRFVGTPNYISPEQAQTTKDVDFRSDIYSLGCTLYHMLSGRAPYTGDSIMDIVQQHIYNPPADILKVRSDCPQPVANLLAKMLRKAPSDRCSSYDELVGEMQRVYEIVAQAGSEQMSAVKTPQTVEHCNKSPATATKTPMRQSPLSTRLVAMVACATLGAVAGAVAIFYHVWSPRNEVRSSGQGTLAVTSDPVGATIFWRSKNGEQKLGTTGSTPLRISFIDEGLQALRAWHPTLGHQEMSVMVKADKEIRAKFVFAPVSSAGLDYLPDDCSNFAGWSYVTGGLFASNGRYLEVVGYSMDGTVAAEKRLHRLIGHRDDFRLAVNLAVRTDPNNRVGAFSVFLQNDANQVVGKLNWHDAQAATGYGGVDFGAEGLSWDNNPIYRSDARGFAQEYPTIDAQLEIVRIGTQWRAFVNGTQKGDTLTFTPTLTATKVKILASDARWNPPAFEVHRLEVTPIIPARSQRKPQDAGTSSADRMRNSIGMELVKVAGVPGINGDCWVDKYEVTQQEYQKVMDQNPSKSQLNPRMPVEFVSFNDAIEFCNRLNKLESSTELRYTLPTEAQWEYLVADARLEDSVTSKGRESRRENPEVVGSEGTKPNKFGLFDIRGNVWEWCDSPTETGKRVRGGAFDGVLEEGLFGTLRIDNRGEAMDPAEPAMKAGFRVLAVKVKKDA